MKIWMKRFLLWIGRRECGESLLIVVFAITALLGVTATVTDLGVAYVKTAQTQTAADAAALAAWGGGILGLAVLKFRKRLD